MGVTDWGANNDPLSGPALGGAGGWADSVAQALNNSDETVDARLATLEAAMEALIDGRVAKTGDTMSGNLVVNTEGDAAANASVATRAAAGRNSGFEGYAGGKLAYLLRLPDTAGNFRLYAYDADGANPKTALRTTGVGTGMLEVFGPPSIANGIATKGYVDAMGEWQDYTPTITGALTLGNGTALGRYSQVNKTCNLQIAITLGTTSVMGSGASITISPPPGATPRSSGMRVRSSARYGRSGVNAYHGIAEVANGAILTLPQVVSGTTIANGQFPDVPFPWAANDAITFAVTYETT